MLEKEVENTRSNNSELLTITSTYVPSHHRFIQQPLNKSTFPAGFTPLPFPNYGNAFSQNAQIDAYLKLLQSLMQARQLLETVSSAYADSLVAGCIKQINREIPQSVLPNDN